MKKIALNAAQRYTLNKWFDLRYDEIGSKSMTKSEAASFAQEQLGFHVTTGHMETCLKASQVNWPGPTNGGNTPVMMALCRTVTRLCTALDITGNDIDVLTNFINQGELRNDNDT